MRTAIYLAALILADAVLRANTYYHETEMRWLYVAGVLFLVMDLSDWSRSTWDWIASKQWRKNDCLKQIRKQYYPGRSGPKRYELTYRGPDAHQRGGPGPAHKV